MITIIEYVSYTQNIQSYVYFDILQKKARLHLLYQEDAAMTAYGFFNMDFPLIQSVGELCLGF